jgi:signal transduction histidine kinase
MRLSAKTNLYYFFCASIVFVVGGIAFYYILHSYVRSEADEQLTAEKTALIKSLQNKSAGEIDDLTETQNENIRLVPLKDHYIESGLFYDSLVYIKPENETVTYRICSFSAEFYNKNYRIILSKSLIESENLAEGISIATLFLFSIMLISISIVSHFTTKRIWRPFYQTLEKASAFEPDKLTGIELPPAKITEFQKLNESFNKLFANINRDFKSLKEYTENASHELQTPLAVIRSQLEILIQSENLTDKQSNAVKNIFEATSKMSKLSRALLLLMKIDNSQFADRANVNLSELLQNKILAFEDFSSRKNIHIEQTISADIYINLNSLLADVLVTNLLNNAVKHNLENGFIDIRLSQGVLIIKNSGEPYTGDTERLFDRFIKEGKASDSVGLGLPIVKKICEMNGLSLLYEVEKDTHIFTVFF